MILNLFLFIFCATLNGVISSDESRIVILADGAVKGDKYWNGEFYEFYGVPYATAPTGRDRFQAPLPPEPWEGVIEASRKSTLCQQCYVSGDTKDDIMVDGKEDCLVINLLVPQIASETNLLPIVVYIHSGAFSGGSGTMTNFHYVARHDVITISFNYRVGALGFACLGNKEIPGNAGLKDQVAALRWIKKNIKKFGGDPAQVTLAGFSVGATMAELLSLSKATKGLFNRIILDSGSALAPFAINRDPIATAKNVAISLGYNETVTLEGLTEFYLTTNITGLAEKSVNFHLKNSTFGFAPCIENDLEDIEPIITESPLETLKKGRNNDVAVLTGFADMEGLSRSIKFGTWREDMNEDFSEFLPADLKFNNDKERDNLINEIKKFYFDNMPVNAENLQNYVHYFSDVMFKYNILKSAKLHAASSKKPVYLYEFSYVGKLSIEHNYMDRIKGASHRDQTAYILDFFGHTSNYKDLDTRDRLTTMWTDFVKYEDPTRFESFLINVKWLPYTNNKRNYLEISKKLQMKKNLFEERFNFWDKIYNKYYWTPTSPTFQEDQDTNKEKETLEEKKKVPHITKKQKAPEKEVTEHENKTLKEKSPQSATEAKTEDKNNGLNKNTATETASSSEKKILQKENNSNEKVTKNIVKNTPEEQNLPTENKKSSGNNTPQENKNPANKDTTKIIDTKNTITSSKEKKNEKENNNPKELKQ